VAGDVVGVIVRLQHVLDANAVQAREPHVRVDVPLRVDHRGDALARVSHQIGGAAEVLVDHLAEEHARPVCQRAGASGSSRLLLCRAFSILNYPTQER
jgi:hypothetical protein